MTDSVFVFVLMVRQISPGKKMFVHILGRAARALRSPDRNARNCHTCGNAAQFAVAITGDERDSVFCKCETSKRAFA